MAQLSSAAREAFPDHLIAMALPMESRGLLERAGAPLLYTGVGKLLAAMALTRRLADYRHAGVPMPLVVNLGTAGSRHLPSGSLVACHRFMQRDMDVSGLGFVRGETPYDEVPPTIEMPEHFHTLPHCVCSTADSFATHEHAIDGDVVVDMEAFALARVCVAEGARFACAKYVTDGADGTAGNDWRTALEGASLAFAALYATMPR
ncbi:MAG: hypothetical protein R3F58_12600 [Steroidobacteraceae bacterium]|nr:hypothetical protein [Steroidobacteraceae bacterium]